MIGATLSWVLPAQHFACIIAHNLQNGPRNEWEYIPLERGGNWGLEKYGNLLMVPRPVSVSAGVRLWAPARPTAKREPPLCGGSVRYRNWGKEETLWSSLGGRSCPFLIYIYRILKEGALTLIQNKDWIVEFFLNDLQILLFQVSSAPEIPETNKMSTWADLGVHLSVLLLATQNSSSAVFFHNSRHLLNIILSSV